MMNVINLSDKNVDQAAETLSLAFSKDPLMLWLFDGQENYNQKAQWAIKKWIKWCMLYGIAIATPHCESVALRKKPDKHTFTFWGLLRSGMWRTPAVLGSAIFNRIITLDKLLHEEQLKNMGSNRFWYCWLIGTHPKFRQQGYGKSLMDYTFMLARESKLPCYLETATKVNLAIHEKQGYKHLSTIQLPNSSVELYCMARYE